MGIQAVEVIHATLSTEGLLPPEPKASEIGPRNFINGAVYSFLPLGLKRTQNLPCI